MRNRKMTEGEARQRISTAVAGRENRSGRHCDRNDNSFEQAWKQVNDAWNKNVPRFATGETFPAAVGHPARRFSEGEISVSRAKPRDLEMLAQFINRVRRDDQPLTRDDMMAAFGEKAFLTLRLGSEMRVFWAGR